MKNKFNLLALLLICFIDSNAQKTVQLKSPNGQIATAILIGKEGIQYQVAFEKNILINWSKLALTFDGKEFSPSVTISKPMVKDSIEKYDLIIGKTSHVEHHYKEVTIPLRENEAPHTQINIVFRAFDDGIAFRYEMISRDKSTSFLLTDEVNEFRVVGNPIAKVLELPSFTSSHEGFYTTLPLSDLPANKLMDMPALFQFPGNTYLAITEAALLDYAGMYLMKENGVLISKLSPLPSNPTIKVKATFPHKSPWRLLMISHSVGDFISSNILTTLSPPSRIKDVSWIKPGKTTFPWWNGNVMPDTINAPGNNFITQKYYIDFCHRNGIEYHSVVEYGLHQWYMDDGVGFQPGPHSDVTTPVPGLNMKEVCDYAHSQGVGVRVWVQWAALYPKLDAAFANFEKWGLSGMMIDFMDRDDQEMVNIQTEMLEKAAKHHLHIQFHGAYKPTGLSRTYPNEFTREGTLNYEVNKWGKGITAEHDLDIAFTRMLAGSTDYHLGGFRAIPDSLYRTQYTRPLMLSTRAHMLGMYVVFENALGMACDYPEAYEGQDGFDFLRKVPTTWDETKVLDAKVNEYIIIARRKGKEWFLGSINNSTERDIKIPLSFLSSDNYKAAIYADGADANQFPNKLKRENKAIKRTDTLTVHLAHNGGAVIHFTE